MRDVFRCIVADHDHEYVKRFEIPDESFADTWEGTIPTIVTFAFFPRDGRYDESLKFGLGKNKKQREESYQHFKERLLHYIPDTTVAGIFEFQGKFAGLPDGIGHGVAFRVNWENKSFTVWDSSTFFGKGEQDMSSILDVIKRVPTGGWVCTGITVVCDHTRENRRETLFGVVTRSQTYLTPQRKPSDVESAGLPSAKGECVADLMTDLHPTSSYATPEQSRRPASTNAAGLPSVRNMDAALTSTPMTAPETPATPLLFLPHFGSPKVSNPFTHKFSFVYEDLEQHQPRRQTMETVYASQKQWVLSSPGANEVFLVQAGLWCWLCANAYLGYILEEVLHYRNILKCQHILYALYNALLQGDKRRIAPIDRMLLAEALTEDVSHCGKEMAGGFAWLLLMKLEKGARDREQHITVERGGS